MTTRVDPRLAERRRTVAESNARRRLRKLFWALVVVAVLGAVGWVARSPWFSVANIAVSGVESSASKEILEGAGVRMGAPLITISPTRVEGLLEEDPWVVHATVRRVLPDAVEVAVTERVPAMWVQVGDRWAVVAEDGIVLRFDSEPAGPTLQLDVRGAAAGDQLSDARVTGGLAFVTSLPLEIRPAVALSEREGEVWAEVGEYVVRLGLPVRMAEKGAALLAILEEQLPPGSMINLVAPTRPAVGEA
jgi:cell division septal protein FtsQ